MPKSKQQEKDNPVRQQIAEAIAKVKNTLKRTEEDLDEEGVERKQLTPDIVDTLREGIMAIYPESDEEQVEATMQLIVEAVTEAQPETDVEEERADGDKQDDEEEMEDEKQDGEEEEEKDDVNKALTEELSTITKAYNDLVGDMASVVNVVAAIADKVQEKAEKDTDLIKRVKALEKITSSRPRRASRSQETVLDDDSELGKAVKKQTFTVPEGYEGMSDMWEK